MEIKAIDTYYKNHLFRSRLEARWAVFFDELEWNWRYEFEGFELPSGRYLPDFYFPDLDIFAEVKPKELNDNELLKVVELSEMFPNSSILLLIGLPSNQSLRVYQAGEEVSQAIPISLGLKFYPLYYYEGEIEDYFGETLAASMTATCKRFEFIGRNL